MIRGRDNQNIAIVTPDSELIAEVEKMSLDNLEYSVMLTSLAKKAGEVSIPVTRLASLLVATGLVTTGQLVLAQVYRV